MQTKYKMIIGGKTFPPGTEVELLKYDNLLVQSVFPGMKKIKDSKQVAVRFPSCNHCTILLKKEIE